MAIYKIADEFGSTLFGRTGDDGPLNGTAFRQKLVMWLSRDGDVVLDFSGVETIPSSFFEEAFGGLVRQLSAEKPLLDKLCKSSNLNTESVAELVAILKKRIRIDAKESFIKVRAENAKTYMDLALNSQV